MEGIYGDGINGLRGWGREGRELHGRKEKMDREWRVWGIGVN